MRQIEDARKRYEEIPIPAELSGRVRAAIVRSEEKNTNGQDTQKTQDMGNMCRYGSSPCTGIYYGVKHKHSFCGNGGRTPCHRSSGADSYLPVLREG